MQAFLENQNAQIEHQRKTLIHVTKQIPCFILNVKTTVLSGLRQLPSSLRSILNLKKKSNGLCSLVVVCVHGYIFEGWLDPYQQHQLNKHAQDAYVLICTYTIVPHLALLIQSAKMQHQVKNACKREQFKKDEFSNFLKPICNRKTVKKWLCEIKETYSNM